MKPFIPVLMLALLFVLGPLIAIRPSRRQRRLAHLRATAVSDGLRVRLDPQASRGGCADYVLPWASRNDGVDEPAGLVCRREADGSWQMVTAGTDPMPGLDALLQALPEGVVQLQVSAEGLIVRWDERGEAADVKRIAELLREFATGG